MARQKFQDINFKPETLEIIARANGVVAEYQNAGYRMTLRQLYYQFVDDDALEALNQQEDEERDALVTALENIEL